MVQRSQLSDNLPLHSDAWLLCAACGPIFAEDAERAGFPLEGEPGIKVTPQLCSVREPVPFPVLKQWVDENGTVRAAIERAEVIRNRKADRNRSLIHDELAGKARAALLLDKTKDFLKHYQLYIQERAYEWHPDPGHTHFWDDVLGPGWQGAEFVPEGAARDDIVLLTHEICGLFAYPQHGARGQGLCGAPSGEEWLEVAAALRVADAEALEAHARTGSSLALAARELLGGQFAESQRHFEDILGRTEERRYVVAAGRGLALLLYALVGGVLSSGNLRFLRAWFDCARYVAEYTFPPSRKKEQEEVMSFLANLEQVDSIINRNGSLSEMPQVGGALSRLPYAMCYQALPGYVREHLPVDALAAAVGELAASGLMLFACYGEAGLRSSLPEGSKEKLASVRAWAEARGVILPVLPKPATERALEALLTTVRKSLRVESRLHGKYLLNEAPSFVASRLPTGVSIDLSDEEHLKECPGSFVLSCMKKHARDGRLLLEGADAAALTHLFVAMQSQVRIEGSLALPEEPQVAATPQPVLVLARRGERDFLAALRLRLLPGNSLLIKPGCGLSVPVLKDADGRLLAVRRDEKSERKLVAQTSSALQRAGCQWAETLAQDVVFIHDIVELTEVLNICRELSLECCWEKGHAFRLHQPRGGLRLQRGALRGHWLELGGDLPVDEGRVFSFAELLEAYSSRRDNVLKLGESDYVQLTPELERQLALLELVWQEKRGQGVVAASAIPLLDAIEHENTPKASPAPPQAVPAGLKVSLRPYQKAGFHWLAKRAQMGIGSLLADDMGLGKTVQVLTLLLHAAEQPGAGAALVVAPVSLLGNWAEEAARFAPSLNVSLCDPARPESLANAAAGTLVLASYGQVVARQAEFAARKWDVMVLDEAQAIKNPDSQRARAACALRARIRLCLTGTPIENSLLDLWSQMRFLNPGLFGTRAAFQRRFKKATSADVDLLRQVLAPLVLRRTKAEVLTQLPPLTEMVEWVELSHEERALYESLRRAAAGKLGEDGNRVSILAELTRLRRACCHGRLVLPSYEGKSTKLATMAERVDELRAAGHRVLIFSQFTDVLDLAEEALASLQVSYLRLDGSTPAAQRSKAVRDFQKGGADAFLISLKAGGAGLNLTAADYVILLDPWWNPAVEAQAAGRSHRMGQAHPVTLCRFMVRGTVEERIMELHRDKKDLAEQVLDGRAEGMSLINLRNLLGA